MGIEDFYKYDVENTLVDEVTWNIILEPALKNDPAAAEILGRLLLYLKEAIEPESARAAPAINTLMEGINLVYPYTTAFELSRKLWMLSLEGYLTPPNEPDRLIEKSLENGWKETLKGRRRAARRHKKGQKGK